MGAHIGFFTHLFSRLTGSAGKIFAFEPCAANLERLRKNMRLNSSENVWIQPTAVSDRSGMSLFLAHASRFEGRPATAAVETPPAFENSYPIETISLDDFVYREKNPPPDLVKIDVEGAESNILQGMRRVLAENKPLLVIEITNAVAGERVLKELWESGYDWYPVSGENKPNPEHIHGGHIAAGRSPLKPR